MSKNHRSFYISAVVIGALLPLTPALAADFPIGSYAAGPHVSIVFASDGHFHVIQDKAMQVSGTYTVKGEKVELTDEKGPWACNKEGLQTGTYTWKYDNSVLSFSKVDDSCEDRVGSLTRSVWKQAGKGKAG